MSAIPAIIASEASTGGAGWPSWGAIKDDNQPIKRKTSPSRRRKPRKGIKVGRRGNRGRKGHLRSKARHSNKRRVLLILLGLLSFAIGAVTQAFLHHWLSHTVAGVFDGFGVASLEAIVAPWLD